MKTPLQLFPALFCFLVITGFVKATPQVWTTMNSGGSNNMGVIYKVNADGSNGGVAVTFDGVNGANPSGNLIQGAGGLLYGTTTAGGTYNYGVLFSFDASTGAYNVLHHFNRVDGCAPGDIIIAADGKIYGTTETGGNFNNSNSPNGLGVIYSYNPINSTFSKLLDFNGANGENPQGLMQASNGRLYGLTRLGGAHGRGVLYSFSPNNYAYNVLYSFNGVTGEMPTGCKLTQASDGRLYGMTTWGGANNMGTIFSFEINCFNNYKDGNCNVYTKIYDFNGTNGSYPTGTLMQASDGQLYGVTAYGGANGAGVIFSYNTATAGYTPLHDFDGTMGKAPFNTLVEGTDKKLYGITSEGGTNNQGVIFNYDPLNKTYNVLSDCDGLNSGSRPNGSLIDFEVSTGIKMLDKAHIGIFPNPASDHITIKTVDFIPETLEIFDVNGQQVMQRAFTEKVDLSNLACGLYFIEIRGGGHLVRSRISRL